MKAVLGIAHPVVHNLECELCVTLQADGDFGAAERILKDLSKSEQEFGLDSTTTEIGLAMTYWHQGKWDEAEMLFAKDLQHHLEQGGISFSGLVVMSCLASTYMKQHRYEDAEPLFEIVLSFYEDRLGKEHPDTIKTMARGPRQRAPRYPKQQESSRIDPPQTKNAKEAKDILVDLQATTARVLGEDHPDTLSCIDNLAMTYRDSRELKDAEKLESKVRDRRMEVLGKWHPDTLNSMYNLALIYIDQKRLDDAEKLLLEVVAADFSTHSLENRDTVLSMDALCMIYLDQKRWEDAEKWCKRAIYATLAKSDSGDPYVVYLKANLGVALTNQ
ncbi:TPR-like protein [Wilcoxina mikolae CBS 423.85]|nr:TPR-like protein [Wilcoxina mikolae CBS 423.85]